MFSATTLRRALTIGGATLAGTYAGLHSAQYWYRTALTSPTELRPALDWGSHSLEVRAGRMHYYHRPGQGTPIVLLHSIHSAASSFEMKPIARYLAEETDRPLYAVDWLGFGRSDRPPLSYGPDTYGQQLYQVLTDVVETPASLVALSLGCEYAAWMGLQAAPRVQRLVLISPTGLSASRHVPGPQHPARSIGSRIGLSELMFAYLTQRSSLQEFYETEIFLDPDAVPDSLVDYAQTTSRVRGAHHAPREFIEGRLFLENVADEVFGRLYRPTLLLTPATPGPTPQRFDEVPSVVEQNRCNVTHWALPGGLMPHWEAPDAFFEVLDAFVLNHSEEA